MIAIRDTSGFLTVVLFPEIWRNVPLHPGREFVWEKPWLAWAPLPAGVVLLGLAFLLGFGRRSRLRLPGVFAFLPGRGRPSPSGGARELSPRSASGA